MAVPRPQQILLPVKPAYIAFTITVALLLNLLPLAGVARWIRPDFIALLVLYWSVQQPHRFGMTLAWVLGLVMDVAYGTLFGQHALTYSVIAFAGFVLHRRLRMFGLVAQFWHVLPLMLVAQALLAVLAMAKGGLFPGWEYFLGSVFGALLWVPMCVLLRLPRVPKSDPDQV